MIFNEYSDVSAMMQTIADQLAQALRGQLEHAERATLAVAGGTTPGPVFDALCRLDLDWARVDIMLTDERWVAEDNPRSNTGLLRARLLVEKAAKAGFVPLFGGTDTPEESLAALTQRVQKSLPLTAVLLGMGEDMHTASIFPGADQLTAALTSDVPLLAMRAPAAPEPRMTLSAQVLNGASAKHLVIIGAQKRAAFEKAQELPADIAPIRAVMQGLNIHWTL